MKFTMICWIFMSILGKSFQEIMKLRGTFISDVTYSMKLWTTNVKSLNYCSVQCAKVKSCTSFSHNKNTNECSLHPLIHDPGLYEISSAGWRLYELYTDTGSIQDGYEENREFGIRYKIHLDKVTCSEAKTVCQDDGGGLIRIDSAERQHFVETLMANNVDLPSTFVDGYRVGYSWYHDDGSPISYSKWDYGEGQPNNNAPCIGIMYDFSGDYLWHDIPASWQLEFICEKTITA